MRAGRVHGSGNARGAVSWSSPTIWRALDAAILLQRLRRILQWRADRVLSRHEGDKFPRMRRPDVLAAVDLGSNSFHLQVGRVVDGQIYALDSMREALRLGAGLTADKRIDRATQVRALEVLARFGERLRGLPPSAVRAVGTNTLRVAKNAAQFLREARSALGFPIEVIAGREEARLIYLGVSHSLPPAQHRRLVVDVGGGSTEFIIGSGFEAQLTESLYMGCVSWSLRYFPGGKIDKGGPGSAGVAR